MSWSQESERKIVLSNSTTSAHVGPGKYNIQSESFAKVKPSNKRCFEPRECFPRTGFVTPGPGSYATNNPRDFSNRPVSSFFKSRTQRSIYNIVDTPSSCQYSVIEDWSTKERKLTQTHHPRVVKRRQKVEPTADYLDEKGRLVRRNTRQKTEADLGPGTYDPKLVDNGGRSHNMMSGPHVRDPFGIRSYDVPTPEKYSPVFADYKLPIKIKGEYKVKDKIEVVDSLSPPPTRTIPTYPTPVFANRQRRDDLFKHEETPGPGAYSTLRKTRPKTTNCGVAFGTRDVRIDNFDNGNPGPSDYYIPKITQKLDGSAAVMKNRALTLKPYTATPDEIGPGSYDITDDRISKYQQSPEFKYSSERMKISQNDYPGPADYHPDRSRVKGLTINNTRYPKVGNWMYAMMSSAPSPENFSINRDLQGQRKTISRNQRFGNEKRVDTPGPGSYNISPPTLKKSFNSGCPRLN